MNKIFDITKPLLYILYGVIKISVGLAVLLLSPEQVGKIPIANLFVKEAADKTLAGHMYEYVLMAFGVFTIIHGLVIFNVLPLWFIKIFVTKTVQYTVLTVLGLILTIFYSLVLYTDNLSSKDSHGTAINFRRPSCALCPPGFSPRLSARM